MIPLLFKTTVLLTYTIMKGRRFVSQLLVSLLTKVFLTSLFTMKIMPTNVIKHFQKNSKIADVFARPKVY